MEFRHVTDSALHAACDLLAFTTFGDPSKDATFKAIDHALGGGLRDAATAESFDGKPGQSLVFWTGGKLPAKRIAVIGLGARGEVEAPALRDAAASAAQIANRGGAVDVVYVMPNLGAAREARTIQATVEGVIGGTYRFGRYLTSDDAKKVPSLVLFGIAPDARGTKKPPLVKSKEFQVCEPTIEDY